MAGNAQRPTGFGFGAGRTASRAQCRRTRMHKAQVHGKFLAVVHAETGTRSAFGMANPQLMSCGVSAGRVQAEVEQRLLTAPR